MTDEQKKSEIVQNSHQENKTEDQTEREIMNGERYAGLSTATKKILEKGTLLFFGNLQIYKKMFCLS